MPDEIQVAETPCLEFEILSRTGTTLMVQFKNPLYIGEMQEQEVDGEVTLVDVDPNQHITKSINIPMNADGTVDRVVLNELLYAQARGVQNRMEQARAAQAVPNDEDLDSLIGALEV